MRIRILLILALMLVPLSAQALSISLDGEATSTSVEMAVVDTLKLLREGFPEAEIGRRLPRADVRIHLPPATGLQDEKETQALQGYRWRSVPRHNGIDLWLEASTPLAVSHGLYGLLQEKLGFRFVHPRQTVIPRHGEWPLPDLMDWTAKPRFAVRGFHLHTQHPIELTEPLLNPNLPEGTEAVYEYLDWLVRNGQNRMQFYLLRTVDPKLWPEHARKIVSYAHRRGLQIGVMVSLSMIQQNAFQMTTLGQSQRGRRRQIDRTLKWLFHADWDFVTVEYTLGEHLADLREWYPDTAGYLLRELQQTYGVQVQVGTHVDRNYHALFDPEESPWPKAFLKPEVGVLVHTVMFYGLTDSAAPAYGNSDFRQMHHLIQREARRRPVWYFPESSYWVAFDSSVPLFLLSYLQARWQDIQALEGSGVQGHLTFTSGWEWGYWLVDWSVARWSWDYGGSTHPLDGVEHLFGIFSPLLPWGKLMQTQDLWLKRRNQIAHLVAADPFSEMPGFLMPEFAPRSQVDCANLLYRLSRKELQQEALEVALRLDSLAEELATATRGVSQAVQGVDPVQRALFEELLRAFEVTSLRARHRSLILRALAARPRPLVGGGGSWKQARSLVEKAEDLRLEAIAEVHRQEAGYRYPLKWIARRQSGSTVYDFGYLYPASRLFFWQREEGQVLSGRCDPFYRKIWNFRRTLGLGSLFQSENDYEPPSP